MPCCASIVVVAKCPIPGQSKTRLIDLLGEEGSAVLAKAMLADVLTCISHCVSASCLLLLLEHTVAAATTVASDGSSL